MQRHDLLRVAPHAWHAILARHAGVAALPHVATWAMEQRPVIVRRYLEGEAHDAVPVALPLPPSVGKHRVALSLEPTDPIETMPSVRLREARSCAPEAWQSTIDRLLAVGEALGCVPSVFGALAWQQLTGLTYLSATSDIDLLWTPRDAERAVELVHDLSAIDVASPCRIDGEIVFPDGSGVNWRELAGSADTVLAKTMRTVEMRPRATLF